VHHWPPSSDALTTRSPERYVLPGGGPAAASDELEHRTRLAIEVIVLWRGDVLSVAHLSPPGAFFVGGSSSACDVALPVELLGARRLCVAVGSRSEVSAVLPPQARGWLALPDGSLRPFAPSPMAPESEPSASGERLLPLGPGQRAHLCFEDLEIQVAPVAAGRAPGGRRSLGFEGATLAYFGLSALSVAGVLSLLSLAVPPLGLNQDERAATEQLYVLQSYLTASAERSLKLEREAAEKAAQTSAAASPRLARPLPPPARSPAPRDDEEDEAAAQSASDPLLTVDSELALDAAATPTEPGERRSQIKQARGFGMIGLFKDNFEALNDPQLKYRREMTGEEHALLQQLFNPDSAGHYDPPGGLALSGTGIGGGGQADEVALGAVRTVAKGEGGGLERFSQLGSPMGSHRPHPPQLRHGNGLVANGLPPALLRRSIGAQFSRLRACYEAALADGPTLAGRVVVDFVVLPDGHVDSVSAQSAELPAGVRSCIEGVFGSLQLPSLEAPVHVAYPLELAP
jgi:hypothetical protein